MPQQGARTSAAKTVSMPFGLFKKKKKCQPCEGQSVPPEEDIAIAESEFREGNLKHAAHHVGCALVSDPNRAEWLLTQFATA